MAIAVGDSDGDGGDDEVEAGRLSIQPPLAPWHVDPGDGRQAMGFVPWPHRLAGKLDPFISTVRDPSTGVC